MTFREPQRTTTPAIWTRQGLVIALVAAIAVSALLPIVRRNRGDFPVYKLAAERVQAGETFYRTETGGAFSYPPFMVLPFVPLSWLPDLAENSAYWFANIVMLGASLTLLAKLVIRGLRARSAGNGDLAARPHWPALVLIVLLSGRFVISPLENQSNDPIVFLFVMLGVTALVDRRSLRGGMWLGLAAAAKATPLLFLPICLLQRRWATSAAMVAGIVIATLSVDLCIPHPQGSLWGVEWYQKFVSKVDVGGPAEAQGAWVSWNHLNQSLSGTLYRLSTPVSEPNEHVWDASLADPGPALRKAVTLALQLGVLCLVVLGCTRRKAPGESTAWQILGDAGCVLCGMLLLSPMSSKQHFVVLVVPVSYAVVSYFYVSQRRWLMIPAAMLLALGTFATKDLIGRPMGNELLAYGALTWCTLAVLITTVILQRQRSQGALALDGQPPAAAESRRSTQIMEQTSRNDRAAA